VGAHDDGREVAVEATGNTVINDPMYALDLARAGVGLACSDDRWCAPTLRRAI
jgi:hypothetical protein